MSKSYEAGYAAGKAKQGHLSGRAIEEAGYDLRDFVRGYRAGWNA